MEYEKSLEGGDYCKIDKCQKTHVRVLNEEKRRDSTIRYYGTTVVLRYFENIECSQEIANLKMSPVDDLSGGGNSAIGRNTTENQGNTK